jgi:hypothetical protein
MRLGDDEGDYYRGTFKAAGRSDGTTSQEAAK